MTFVPLSPVPPSTGSSSFDPSSSVPRSPGASLHAALNPPQREAVEHIDGPLLVIAGAGSGKTRVITHRIAHMISQGGVAPHQILAVTFTNKAASEMRERVLQLLGLPSETHLPLGTFHSRCAAILRREAIHTGLSEHYQILDDKDQVNVLKEILRRMGIEPKEVQPSQALEVIGWAKTNLLEPEDTAEVDEFKDPKIPYPEIYKNYQEFLTQNDAVDFDDLLMKTVRLFERNEHILDYWRRRYPYVLVDEYQDTNPAQFRLLQLLAAEHRNLCVVGDEDQSIYSWRGADIHNLLDFQKQFPEARLIRLEQNYRSTQRILQCADSVIVNNKKRLGKTLFTQGDAGEPVVYTRLMDSREEAQWIASKIRELHLHKQYPYSNIAIFYRLNALSRSFEDALREAHIPYRIIGSVRFLRPRGNPRFAFVSAPRGKSQQRSGLFARGQRPQTRRGRHNDSTHSRSRPGWLALARRRHARVH